MQDIPPFAVPPWLDDAATCLGTLTLSHAPPAMTASDVLASLQRPIWPGPNKPSVFDVIAPGESVCLVVSDHTRKTAADIVLPVIVRGLTDRGCSADDMFVLIASGIHRHPSREEIGHILGSELADLFGERIFCHDPDDDTCLVHVGTTRRGHRVRVNRRAVEAQRLVLLGAATYHYHAGFGGGRKSLVPGLAARETIAHNHSLTLDPDADRIHPMVRIGNLDGNPVAEEMFEAAALCRPDIIVNSVLTPSGALAGVFSGDLDAAHRAACRLVEDVCRLDIARPADFVIASAGTASNWIQSHKALFNASRAVHEQGRVILIAPCPEGLGDERFRHWIRKPDVGDITRALRRSCEVLGQTALSTRLRGRRAILVTAMPDADRRDLGIETAPDLESAVRKTLDHLRADGREAPAYYTMPQARHTVPFQKDC